MSPAALVALLAAWGAWMVYLAYKVRRINRVHEYRMALIERQMEAMYAHLRQCHSAEDYAEHRAYTNAITAAWNAVSYGAMCRLPWRPLPSYWAGTIFESEGLL